MIANCTFQRRDHVGAVVGADQSQHAGGLMFAITLLLQQSFQESAGHLSQFAEPLPQLLQLLAVTLGWTMFRVDATLAGLSYQQEMPC